jgi:spermidine synthase
MHLLYIFRFYLPIIAVLLLGGLLNLYLLEFYRAGSAAQRLGSQKHWLDRWDFSPEKIGGFSYKQLALVSMVGLFLELLMIRWISSEIRIFAYFKNFVLIACFLGFGLGCYMCKRRLNLVAMFVPLLSLALLVKLPWEGLRNLIDSLPAYLGSTSEVQVWGVPSLPLSRASLTDLVLAVAVIVPIFAFISFVFIPLGQLVGWYLENARQGILGYTVNVLGSLAGILLYTFLCFLYQPPPIWFLLSGAMLLLLCWRLPIVRWGIALVFALCIALTSIGPSHGAKVYWSPYQKLTLSPALDDGELVAYELQTNGSWYQQILDLSPGFVASHPRLFKFPNLPVEWNPYNLPYRFYPQPHSVLVLGAGMGNDVAAALRNGSANVVAVEIDPLILTLGRQLHFEKPYQSPRVHVVVDDARSYLQNGSDKFDLIVFSLLDSHTTSSHYSNIRIDNYVYTLEALRTAKQRLRSDGVFIIKFQVNTPWIAGRLFGLVENVFGQKPLEIQDDYAYSTGGRFFIVGSPDRLNQALTNPQLAAFMRSHSNFKMEPATLTTDDWPYFYQHEPGVPASVIIVAFVLIFLTWFFLRQTGSGSGSMRWTFFFLGAGFMLLEAQIVSKMALLFGTTWVVNSIVISGLLLLIVGANTLVEFRPRISVSLGYAGIFATLLAAYLIPLEKYFFHSLVLKMLAATAVLCLPVFFAGIVFIQLFAAEHFSGHALGSNLLGALVGGMLESLSFWTGIRSLLILAAILYLASWIILRVPSPILGAAPVPDAAVGRRET